MDSCGEASRRATTRSTSSAGTRDHRPTPSGIDWEWGEQDSNLRRLSRRVYSAFPLTARASPRSWLRATILGVLQPGERPFHPPVAGSNGRSLRPSRRKPSIALGRVAQPLRLGQRLQPLQRRVLDLADPLARDAKRAANLLECPSLVALQPEAHLDDLTIALGQGLEGLLNVLAPNVLERQLVRRLSRGVLDEVA